MWREVEEELRTSYNAEDAAAIKKALRGMPLAQTRRDFEQKIVRSCQEHDDVRKVLGTPSQITLLLEALYRVGAIGTRFSAYAGGRNHIRDAWVFRHSYEPRFDGEITFHVSLRKALQLVGGAGRHGQAKVGEGLWRGNKGGKPKRGKPARRSPN